MINSRQSNTQKSEPSNFMQSTMQVIIISHNIITYLILTINSKESNTLSTTTSKQIKKCIHLQENVILLFICFIVFIFSFYLVVVLETMELNDLFFLHNIYMVDIYMYLMILLNQLNTKIYHINQSNQ